MRAARLPDGDADALGSGLWPSLDVLPPEELARTGQALAPCGGRPRHEHHRAEQSRLAGRAVLLVVMLGLVGGFFAFRLHHALTLKPLQSHRDELVQTRDRNPVPFAGGYLLAYILIAVLAIPGALVLTVTGGPVFGLVEDTVLASFRSSLGATLALLASRYLFRGWVEPHFRKRLDRVNRALGRDGWLYLVSLCLVPAIPFFVVDLLFGVTAFPVLRFYAVSQAAMLPATLVYVNAGTQVEHLTSLSGILSPALLVSMVLLACLPLAARGLIKLMVKRR